LLGSLLKLLIVRRLDQGGWQSRDGSERRHFRHAPRMNDVDSVSLLETIDDRRWDGRAANEHHPQRRDVIGVGICVENLQHVQPDRRHARRERGPLALIQVEQCRRIQVWPRERQFRARHDCGVRKAPCICVEHRNDRCHHIVLTKSDRISEANAKCVKNQRPVRVQHTFRPSRRPRGVAHGRGGLLVRIRPNVCRAALCQQPFIG